MTSARQQPPTRAEVADLWRRVGQGAVTRELVSQWAEPLMLAEFDSEPDPLVGSALQDLHGFDMTYRSDDGRLIGHGPPGRYVRTLPEVAALLDEWLADCAAHDADPEGWRAEKRAAVTPYLRAERDQQHDRSEP